jgi:hypothetical protein
MIPYMDLNEQVDADFTRARRQARLRAVVARIRREHISNRLLSFDDVRRELVANNHLHRGTRVVEADEIVGSVGRWVVERSFAWISHNRRMSKDYERLCACVQVAKRTYMLP